ncbi:MqnA/MqnD/SBP family protein [Ottowia thiooxydans]|uniref:MqnA/MqnD/SBP family protein n=1 Tax=Ottowia thiooxydans TaxID=219182 RepID=UPI000400659D|nr:MqnA/MqnD/SBP family protein [Ottowia thiooxydans]
MPKLPPTVGHFSSVPWIPYYTSPEVWPVSLLPCESSEVRQLATRGQVDITPMAVADWFELGDTWHRLGSWGISFRGKADSVCLFSPRPIEDLHLAEIAISKQTTSAVRILQALLKGKYGLGIGPWRCNVNVEDTTTPRLLIQNEAVEELGRKRFAYVYDLGREWHDWQSTPVVPAVWVYRAGTDPSKLELVQQLLADSVARYRSDPMAAVSAHRMAYEWAPSVEEVVALHGNFDYDLSDGDFTRGIERMRALLPRQVEGFEIAQRQARCTEA